MAAAIHRIQPFHAEDTWTMTQIVRDRFNPCQAIVAAGD
jgi:hypothetical protein